MILKQIKKNIIISIRSKVNLMNTVKRSIFFSYKNSNIFSLSNYLSKRGFIFKKNFFSKNKEEKKESEKEEDEKKQESMKNESNKEENNNESDKSLNEKYKELKSLFNEQEQKLDQVKKKFHEIKDLYLKGIEEIDAIKLRNEREIKNTKEYAITKFAKDLLDVHDNFTRALNVLEEKDFKTLSPEEKDETFKMFVEGINKIGIC